MTTDTQRATTDLRQHPHAQFFRDNPTYEPVNRDGKVADTELGLRVGYRFGGPDGGHTASALGDASGVPDLVNHPPHYTSDPSGVECIQITRHRNFNVGNAIKYLFRAGLKESANQSPLDKQIEDLKKAVFYINDEIGRLEATR